MKKTFFKLTPSKEVFEIIDRFPQIEGSEEVEIEDSLGRILSKDIYSPSDMPGFLRATMDGFAVKAKDTFGASPTLPAILKVKGEIKMGEIPSIRINDGEAAKISTGGMLPEGADGVVMIEYCHFIDEDTIEVERAISPLENVMQPDDDIKKGEIVLRRGRRIRPQDIGALAGLGIRKIEVFRKVKVAIISTGDEVIPIDKEPRPGQVRDINRYTLSSLCRAVGAEPIFLGICPDRFDMLKRAVEKGLEISDTVWISGGSSVGVRDLTLSVLDSISGFELLVHGIAISPGKPTIIGKVGKKPIIGLPGQVSSAFIVAEVFLSRLLRRLSGEEFSDVDTTIDAIMKRNIESATGREDYIRVRLIKEGEKIYADPVIGKSGLISPLVEADGLVRIDMNKEGLYKDEKVKVIPFISK